MKLLTPFALCLLFISCHGQPVDQMSVAHWNDDLKQLYRILESKHPQLHRFTSIPEFDKLYAETENALSKNPSIEEGYQLFARLVARVGCGHTQINLPTGFWEKQGASLFPLYIMISDGKLLVTHSKHTDIPVAVKYLKLIVLRLVH